MSDEDVPVRMTYDGSVDTAYIHLVRDIGLGGVDRTVCIDPGDIGGIVNVDLDAEGRILGIEVLNASAKLPEGILRRLRD